LPKSFCLFLFSFFVLLCNLSKAQDPSIESIKGQPAPEVYDLLKDSKGYVWLAHELGVSRYDGSSFINLNNPNQNSFAMTDLAEDKKGRIWCHNFTSQIFYIENLKLHLLSQYKYDEEEWFPRMVICGDELVVTSKKGLFVYNLITDKSTYHYIPEGTKSLVRVGKRVVCHAKTGWYCYEAGKPISKLSSSLYLPLGQAVSLQNVSFKDTFYLTANPLNTYYTLTLDGNDIKVHAENKTSAFLNTISVQDNQVWVHTKNYSFTTDGKDTIEGMNLSDVITDSKGYKWMGSLKKGLCIQYNTQQIKKLNLSALSSGDYVRRIHTHDNQIFLTTANGKLYKLNAQSALTYILSIPKPAGIIEQITSIGKNQYLLAASVGLYLYNSVTGKLSQLTISYTVKDLATNNGKTYLAIATGVSTIEKFEQKLISALSDEIFNKKQRCRSVAFSGDSLLAAYSDGVYTAYNGTLHRLLYKGHPVYASKIKVVSGKVLIGTFNQGLLIIENGTIKNLTERDGLISNSIKDIKTSAGSTWLMYNDDFQKLNPTLTGIENNPAYFPKITGINDLGVLYDKLYIADNESVYSIRTTASVSNINIATYIDRVVTNGQELIAGNKLAYFQNHLQFYVSTPFYSPHSKIIYQYRIKSATDSAWQTGAPGQSTFDVIALEPGRYMFEIVAADNSRKVISLPAVYYFEIVPPWYQTWAFRGVVGLVVVALGFFIVRYYYKTRLRKQRVEYEKILAVQTERQRISSEIHDDIGAGLSAIRLLTEMTKDKLPESEARREVGKIHASISELAQKMREVIWSLNTDNDHLENLLFYIQRQANLLFENSSIRLKVFFPTQEIPDIVIKGDKRRHIYLSVKEALHNCLKHSEAQTCHLSMSVENRLLQITITDDGKGFAPIEKWQTGNGLTGMKRRMQQINGYFEVQSKEKTEVRFIVPLNERS
jgi:signal transduction histidine kinase